MNKGKELAPRAAVSTPEVPIREVPPAPVVVVKAKVSNSEDSGGFYDQATGGVNVLDAFVCQKLCRHRDLPCLQWLTCGLDAAQRVGLVLEAAEQEL